MRSCEILVETFGDRLSDTSRWQHGVSCWWLVVSLEFFSLSVAADEDKVLLSSSTFAAMAS